MTDEFKVVLHFAGLLPKTGITLPHLAGLSVGQSKSPTHLSGVVGGCKQREPARLLD